VLENPTLVAVNPLQSPEIPPQMPIVWFSSAQFTINGASKTKLGETKKNSAAARTVQGGPPGKTKLKLQVSI
jgi:hypothetical protein